MKQVKQVTIDVRKRHKGVFGEERHEDCLVGHDAVELFLGFLNKELSAETRIEHEEEMDSIFKLEDGEYCIDGAEDYIYHIVIQPATF